MLSASLSFIFVSSSVVSATSFSLPLVSQLLMPSEDNKPKLKTEPNAPVTVSMIFPNPDISESPICSINFPLRMFFNSPSIAPSIVSIRLEIRVPMPSFRMSRIFNTAATICPINPAFSILSEKLSPILLNTSADSLPASEIPFPVSFSPSAASLASLIALRPFMPPFNSSKEFHSSDSWDKPDEDKNVPISLIG